MDQPATTTTSKIDDSREALAILEAAMESYSMPFGSDGRLEDGQATSGVSVRNIAVRIGAGHLLCMYVRLYQRNERKQRASFHPGPLSY
mgnify:CR=1 FL=1